MSLPFHTDRATFLRAGTPRVVASDTHPETLAAWRARYDRDRQRDTADFGRDAVGALFGVVVTIVSMIAVWAAMGAIL